LDAELIVSFPGNNRKELEKPEITHLKKKKKKRATVISCVYKYS